jgi:predicted esterase
MHLIRSDSTSSRGNGFCQGMLAGVSLLFLATIAQAQTAPVAEARGWSEAAEQALSRAGTNRPEMARALEQTPQEQREGMQFLVENMPAADLRSLSANFLLDHVALVYGAFAKAPWHDRVPKDIFLNDVLPYACLSETREAWGATLRDICAPLAADAASPGAAAQLLNKKLFPQVHVKYSTARRKAVQSPSETMGTGLATCSGLSILLVDACRSVGVPARVAGIPMWVDNRGNHAWVEVWDGQWHFAGAAEPDSKGLDHAWFEHDASLALKDTPIHSIYAASFKKTGLAYPGGEWMVDVVNVTDRYTATAGMMAADLSRLQVKVMDSADGRRIAAKVTVSGPTNYAVCLAGTSKNEEADLNEYLSFNVKRGEVYQIKAEWNGKTVEKAFAVGTNDEAVAVVAINDAAAAPAQTHAPSAAVEPDREHLLLQIKVLDHLGGRGIAVKVAVTNIMDHAVHFEGVSKDEADGTNEVLSFLVARGQTYEIRCEQNGLVAGRMFTAPEAGNRAGRGAASPGPVVISLADSTIPRHPPQPAAAPAAAIRPLQAADAEKLKKELTGYFTATADQQTQWKFSGDLEKLLLTDEPAVRRAAWEAYKAAPVHDAVKQDFDSNQVTFQKYLSPYTVRTVGTRPANGWPLFIAMHGGGGTAKSVNDSQWVQMQHYYKDHPEAGGYKYLALRAPNDTWNGFYDVYVYPLIDNLIRQFTLFGDVDCDKVFIMGYSHGGYGAFAIGPKEPDLFAAIHASAGAPTDGETTGKTLRTTVFTVMVGELDKDYGRFDRDQAFRKTIGELRGERTDIYPVTVQFIPNNPHTGLPDRDKILEMYPVTRNPVPREMTWLMTDKVITDFFWARTDEPGKGKEIDAECRDNRLTVKTTHVNQGAMLLDSLLVDFSRPVILDCNRQVTRHNLQPALKTLCETLLRRGDLNLAFTAELALPPGTPGEGN